MRRSAALVAMCLCLAFETAMACGTRTPEVQSKIDAAELATLRSLVSAGVNNTDLIFIGTVTALDRPAHGSGEFGTATFDVAETLKGPAAPSQTLRWKTKFIYSCQESDTFYNVGFRNGGNFIVYVRDGEVTRSAAADQLRDGASLKLNEERAIISKLGGR